MIAWIIVAVLLGLLLGALDDIWMNFKEDRDIEREAGQHAYLKECGFSPNECSEYHLPGDCPLCGAG